MERLRAAITPQAAALLIGFMILAAVLFCTKDVQDATQLEARSAQVLSQIQGAGKVSVVISMRTQSAQPSSLGLRGETREQVPCGAVAVAQGADDPFVCAQLTQALCALLGLPASAVSVISGG